MTAARGSMAPDIGGLGKKVEKPKEQPKARAVNAAEHIYRDANGRLYTENRPIQPEQTITIDLSLPLLP